MMDVDTTRRWQNALKGKKDAASCATWLSTQSWWSEQSPRKQEGQVASLSQKQQKDEVCHLGFVCFSLCMKTPHTHTHTHLSDGYQASMTLASMSCAGDELSDGLSKWGLVRHATGRRLLVRYGLGDHHLGRHVPGMRLLAR